MLLYFYQNSFSYVAWYQLKLGWLFFPEQGDRISPLDFAVAAAPWAAHPAEEAAPEKGAESSSWRWRNSLHQPQDLPLGHHTAFGGDF